MNKREKSQLLGCVTQRAEAESIVYIQLRSGKNKLRSFSLTYSLGVRVGLERQSYRKQEWWTALSTALKG